MTKQGADWSFVTDRFLKSSKNLQFSRGTKFDSTLRKYSIRSGVTKTIDTKFLNDVLVKDAMTKVAKTKRYNITQDIILLIFKTRFFLYLNLY